MMNASLIKSIELPAIPENCFYFVDNPKALAARSGIKAKVANARRNRERSRKLDRKGVPLSTKERIANYAWFYAVAKQEGLRVSPFDNE